MSEQSSFYARINISKENLASYLKSPVKPITEYKEWLEWSSKIDFYGEISKSDLLYEQFFNLKTPQEYLSVYLSEKFVFNLFDYNEEKEQLIIFILQFSDNVMDCIRMMHVIGGIAQYKNTSITDFAVSYDFMFGLEATNYLEIMKEKSFIRYGIPESLLVEANTYLSKRIEMASEEYVEK